VGEGLSSRSLRVSWSKTRKVVNCTTDLRGLHYSLLINLDGVEKWRVHSLAKAIVL